MSGIRRTWDKEFFEKKAKDRAEHGDEYVDGDESNRAKQRRIMKEEFMKADDAAAGTKAPSHFICILLFTIFLYDLA